MPIVRAIAGALLLLIAVPMLIAGAGLWAVAQHREPGGAFQATTEPISTGGAAIVVWDLDALLRREAPFARGGNTTLRIDAPGQFVGLGPRAAVEHYLDGARVLTVNRVRLARGPLPVDATTVLLESAPVGSPRAGTGGAGSAAPDPAGAGSQAPGSTAVGSGATGSVAPGSVAPGSQAVGSGAVGSAAPGSQAAGSQAPGSVAVGSGAAGSVAPGSQAAGSQAPGSAAVGSGAAGSQAAGGGVGSEAAGAGAVGSASSGSGAVGLGAPLTEPGGQPFWRLHSTPQRARPLIFPPSALRDRQLALVIMNPDGSAGVAGAVTISVTPRWLDQTIWGVVILGTVLLLLGTVALAWPRPRRDVVYVVEPALLPEVNAHLGLPAQATPPAVAPVPTVAPPPVRVRLEWPPAEAPEPRTPAPIPAAD